MNRKFSPRVKKIIQQSKKEALRLGNDFIGAEHLLLGVITEKDSIAVKVLDSLELDLDELKYRIESSIKKNHKFLGNLNEDELKWSQNAEKVLKVTFLEAKSYKNEEIRPEHLMLSILKHNQNEAARILDDFDVDYDNYRAELEYVKQEEDPSFTDFMLKPPPARISRWKTTNQESILKSLQQNLKPRFWITLGGMLPG